MTKQEILEKYPDMFPNGNTSMGWGLEVPEHWIPIIGELCDALQNRGWLLPGGPSKRPQVIADQVKTKVGQLRFYFKLKNVDEEWEKDASKEEQDLFYDKHYQYCRGMVDLAENMIYNMEKENAKEN
jgi:hypothetical protein